MSRYGWLSGIVVGVEPEDSMANESIDVVVGTCLSRTGGQHGG